MSLKNYYEKNVIVVTYSGKRYKGLVDIYTQPNDNGGEEAITLDCGVWLDESDIKTIEII
ncbi:hypothetical protein DW115_01285 [Clostridium sp. AM09-51]|uniref:hypothetical protein n=1 Tax=Pseudoruminococcus massiliensis TaxID=2086583 RepID=UPI000E532F62|nr:hypothetical protein [Pseudoruminococcus massiliensis]RHO50739.1 hypothetical protein DW115_01285 [Clostridium sp. AM09-51]